MTWPLTTRRRAIGTIAATPVALAALGDTAVADEAQRDLAAYGGGPGVADNAPALRAALAAGGGGVLNIGPGIHRIASASLRRTGIALPPGVTIRGRGPSRTILQVTGDTACNLFVAVNRSGVALEALSIVGNGVAPDDYAYGIGAAIRWLLDSRAIADVTGFALRDVHLENFRGAYWVDIENGAPPGHELAMHTIVLERVTFRSRPGNAIRPDDVRFNAAAVSISGYSGAIRGVRVNGLSGDARHIKTAIILYHQIIDAVLNAVTVDAAGVEGATDDAGAYAIQLYDSYYKMSSVTVINPILNSPRSVGIYVAGGIRIAIINPIISGQTDQQAGTLPKGAIVFNGTKHWQVTGGKLLSNWRDIHISPPEGGTPSAPTDVGGRISGVLGDGSSTGIFIGYYAGSVAKNIVVRNSWWRTLTRTVGVGNSNTAITTSPAAGGYIDDIVFDGCHFQAGAGSRALDLYVDSGSPASGYVVSRCTLIGSNPLFARDQIGALRLDGCTVTDLGTFDGAAAATLIGCPELDLRDSTFRSPGRDGIGIDLGGSQGSVRGLRFEECTRALPERALPHQLGRAQPSFASHAAAQVQNLEPAAGEYEAWVCLGGTGWKGSRRQ